MVEDLSTQEKANVLIKQASSTTCVCMYEGIKNQNVLSIGRTSVWRSTKVSAYLTHFCVKCNFAAWNDMK